MNVPFSPPDITQLEIDNVVEVLKSGWITTGPKTKEFEKRTGKKVRRDRRHFQNKDYPFYLLNNKLQFF